MEKRLPVDRNRCKGPNACWKQSIVSSKVASEIELFDSTAINAVHFQISDHTPTYRPLALSELLLAA